MKKKKSKLSVYFEIWYQDYFEYAKFGKIHFRCLRPEILFKGKFDPRNQNWQFKLKFDA